MVTYAAAGKPIHVFTIAGVIVEAAPPGHVAGAPTAVTERAARVQIESRSRRIALAAAPPASPRH
jgi:hypothetical protein